MRNMSYDTRSVIAKECILRICEAAGLRSHTEYASLSVDPKVQEVVKMLDKEPDISHSGSDVILSVSVESLNLTLEETGEVSSCYSTSSCYLNPMRKECKPF